MVVANRRWVASVLPLLSLMGAAHAEGFLKFSSSSFPVPMPGGGEISAVVVPPGKKMTQCPNGRVLIANDNLAPGWGTPKRFDGIVSGVDLLTGSAMKTSTHDQPLPGTDYEHNWSADKNMVSLPNGDVIYQTQSFSKRPVTASGADTSWVATTFHFNSETKQPDFGPGARTAQATWRSEDCGETFQYVGQADPAVFSKGGECAYPQAPAFQQPDNRIFYSMGGGDGPWLGVDRKTGRLLLTYGCVGNFPMGKTPTVSQAGVPAKCATTPKPVLPTGVTNIPPAPKQQSVVFRLSDCLVKKTYVLESISQGTDKPGMNWTALGSIDASWWMWRASAVPLAQNKVAVGWGGAVFLGTPASGGKLNFKSIFDAGIGSGYASGELPAAKIEALGIGEPRPNILTRVPGAPGKVLLAVPATFATSTSSTTPKRTHGYKIFFVNTATGKYEEPKEILDNIVPAGRTTGDLIMQLTAIDTGEGPIFLYWHDVSTASDSATIRGRIYFASDNFVDFVISKSNGNDASFALQNPPGTKYRYRDYKMAEGFRKAEGSITTKTYQYFPVWMQPEGGGTAHFSTVSLNMPSDNKLQMDSGTIDLSRKPMLTRPPRFSPRPSPVAADQIRFLQQHQKQRGPLK